MENFQTAGLVLEKKWVRTICTADNGVICKPKRTCCMQCFHV